MKKILSLFLVFSMVFVCTACAPNAALTEKNVTNTVDTAVKALKEFDVETLEKYVDSSTLSYIMSFAKKHDQFVKLGRAIFSSLEVEIESIDLENQTVTVNVKNKDLYSAASSFTSELMGKYSTFQLLGKLANDNWLDDNLSDLSDRIEEATSDLDTPSVTLQIKQEKKNLVLFFDENAENAVSGGALGAVSSVLP